MAASSKTTIDHEEIRDWAEERDGRPAVVKDTESDQGIGILRIDFGEPEESLEEITWEEFFEQFEESNLAFLYQDETAGGKESRFFKLIRRESNDKKDDNDDTEDKDEYESEPEEDDVDEDLE